MFKVLGLGSFKGAVDPCTMAFQKLPSWVDDNLLPAEHGLEEIQEIGRLRDVDYFESQLSMD